MQGLAFRLQYLRINTRIRYPWTPPHILARGYLDWYEFPVAKVKENDPTDRVMRYHDAAWNFHAKANTADFIQHVLEMRKE